MLTGLTADSRDGAAGATGAIIPWLPQTVRVILRPLHMPYEGPASMEIASISYDPSKL